MGATVLNAARIETRGMLAAGAVLTSGKVIRAGELWTGAPAKLFRSVRDEEFAEMRRNAEHYVRNAERFHDLLRPPENG
jgi:carbonic anhydrase/acetyltransferase-like protein (isoleucine patch superfamily)